MFALAVGDQIPDVTVRNAAREAVQLRDLADGRPVLLVFYLFDFSST